MSYSFNQRFGANGIYTDFRVLIPLAIMIFIGTVGRSMVRGPEEQIADFSARRVETALAEYEAQSAGEFTVAPRSSEPGPATIRIQKPQISMFALLAAGAGGALILGVGVVGSLLLLRGNKDTEEPSLDP